MLPGCTKTKGSRNRSWKITEQSSNLYPNKKLKNQPKKSLFLKAFYIKHWFLRMKIDVLLKKKITLSKLTKNRQISFFFFLFLVLPVYYYSPSSSTLMHVYSVMNSHGLQPAEAPLSMDCSNKNTGVGCQLSWLLKF